MRMRILGHRIVLLLALLLAAVWCGANSTNSMDGLSHIVIKEGKVQGPPKNLSIQASVNGHHLTVVFTENFGQVAIEVSTVSGLSVLD